jgi:hypothetical protein
VWRARLTMIGAFRVVAATMRGHVACTSLVDKCVKSAVAALRRASMFHRTRRLQYMSGGWTQGNIQTAGVYRVA